MPLYPTSLLMQQTTIIIDETMTTMATTDSCNVPRKVVLHLPKSCSPLLRLVAGDDCVIFFFLIYLSRPLLAFVYPSFD